MVVVKTKLKRDLKINDSLHFILFFLNVFVGSLFSNHNRLFRLASLSSRDTTHKSMKQPFIP